MLTLSKLKPLSEKSFAAYGVMEMAYVKRVIADGLATYAIFAADGTPLWVFADRELAFAALRQQEMEPVSVH